VAFYFKKVAGPAVFIAAIISEMLVCLVAYLDVMAYLWLNLLGCALVIVLSLIVQKSSIRKERYSPNA